MIDIEQKKKRKEMESSGLAYLPSKANKGHASNLLPPIVQFRFKFSRCDKRVKGKGKRKLIKRDLK